MKRTHLLRLAAVASALLCLPVQAQTAQNRDAVVAANTEFAGRLYAEIAGGTRENLVFSPFSVSTTLLMLGAGARSDTAAEIEKVLGFNHVPGDVNESFSELVRAIDQAGRGANVQLTMANSLWPQTGATIDEAYHGFVKQKFAGEISTADFARNEGGARARINRWVADRTDNSIRNLLTAPMSRDTRLVVVNAVYFKASWQHAFDAARTEQASFSTEERNFPHTFLMHQSGRFNYGETDTVQILELPYSSAALSMFVVLPRQNSWAALGDLETSLEQSQLSSLVARMKPKEVRVCLPRFTLQWGTASLAEALQKLGLSHAFRANEADFSGITDDRSVFVEDVLHKAFIAVDEAGTEAAAATVGTLSRTAAMVQDPGVSFRADHPFVFFIQDNATRSILFIGRLVEPAGGKG